MQGRDKLNPRWLHCKPWQQAPGLAHISAARFRQLEILSYTPPSALKCESSCRAPISCWTATGGPKLQTQDWQECCTADRTCPGQPLAAHTIGRHQKRCWGCHAPTLLTSTGRTPIGQLNHKCVDQSINQSIKLAYDQAIHHSVDQLIDFTMTTSSICASRQ